MRRSKQLRVLGHSAIEAGATHFRKTPEQKPGDTESAQSVLRRADETEESYLRRVEEAEMDRLSRPLPRPRGKGSPASYSKRGRP